MGKESKRRALHSMVESVLRKLRSTDPSSEHLLPVGRGVEYHTAHASRVSGGAVNATLRIYDIDLQQLQQCSIPIAFLEASGDNTWSDAERANVRT
jgi:hypothetical protein